MGKKKKKKIVDKAKKDANEIKYNARKEARKEAEEEREEIDDYIKDKSVSYFFQELDLNKKFYQLSYGQKKKLQLLLLMLVNKPVWILDDPLSGLDNKTILNLNALFEKKLENKGIIILASQQNISLNNYKTLQLK